jgi:ectoine hydroxylase-related dioxygenase (phytanoyl-CoA dioxygenase family)
MMIIPTSSSFVSPLPPQRHYNCPRLFMSSDVSNLLYEEQESIIVRRGIIEEKLLTNVTPILAPKIKVRGTGKAGGFGNAASGGGGSGRRSTSSSEAEGKEHAKVIIQEGVLRIDNVLSSTTVDKLRDHLYILRQTSEKEIAMGIIQPIQRFAQVLLKQNRCDLTIPLGVPGHEIITCALEEIICNSPIGSTISSILGKDAILHELSCLISDPGSQRQVIHPDTPYIDGRDGRPAVLTCFVALQDITIDMGPTVWLPQTHNKISHDMFTNSMVGSGSKDGESSPKDILISTHPGPVIGLLPKGSCVIFDSRILHCGSANQSLISRALFYFSFKDSIVGYAGNPQSIRTELGMAKVTLGELIDDLTTFDMGKGSCPLIDKLGSQIR